MVLKIDVPEFSDFCFGVKRAISLAEGALKKSTKPVFSLGPLIHNNQVVQGLSRRGLKIADDFKRVKYGTIVICTHGTRPDIIKKIKKRTISIVDTTCPYVKNAQRISEVLSQKGYTLIIVGDEGHPEVKSLKSFSGNKSIVVTTKNEVRKLRLRGNKIGVIAQTTQSSKNFLEVVSELLQKEFSEIRIFNTICSDVKARQRSAESFSRNNGLVIIVGGRNSANTRRLYEICRDTGTEAHHIESARDIKKIWLKGKKSIGIISGASTPRWVVDKVVNRLKNIK